MPEPTFTVTCPCCQARLTVDAELHAIVSHELPPSTRSVNDLGAAVDALRSKSAAREERFRREMQAETAEQKGKLLDRKFQEAFRKAKDSPDPPIKPIDID